MLRLGGPDPLDYVSMYRNVGSPSANIPEHWHYISFGLSDLYGDNRVHEFTGTDGPSGFGFELTFRLKRETGESAPPTWPAELMQGLARYVFQSENTFCSGDHVSWHSPLDNSESRIQHMLLTEDPQMQPVQTPFGVVTFLQIVGVCTEELHSAQQWNGQGILELLRTVPIAGGPWLITDMRRGETIFEIDPHLQQERVDKGIETDGSNLSGVSAKCAWDDLSRPPEDDEDSRSICIGTQPRRLSGKDTEQIRETLRRGLEINSKPVLPPINPQRQNGLAHDRAPSRKDSLESDSSTAIIPHELIRTRQLESVHLKFNQESGALIPLCLRGRLLHGRHFTYKSITGDMAITFVSTGVEGAFATEEHPYAAHGPWLQRPPSCELPSRPVCSPSCVHSFLVISQRGNFCSWQLTIPRGNLILLTEEFVEKMLEDLEDLTSPEEFKLPKEYSWPEKKLKVSILPDVVFDSPLH
ncbi:suppressor of fused homolog isoform X5 [Homo sapiens]|uniref:suppressor of fused homolog isoform X5 n=1 Tax=Homo sapiens TaxID=9606 RepID=UPI0005D03867|nr:suppressor of fused homolog isoform X5 [Homo sapiens]XP_054222043.1 suppressor of fused homolog isoform X5 [Homo sapiens]|eukprot:XP_011538165.1 suppressor of fused homolog isoform X5 [Homo sapiens]